jgi:hypothetical protein
MVISSDQAMFRNCFRPALSVHLCMYDTLRVLFPVLLTARLYLDMKVSLKEDKAAETLLELLLFPGVPGAHLDGVVQGVGAVAIGITDDRLRSQSIFVARWFTVIKNTFTPGHCQRSLFCFFKVALFAEILFTKMIFPLNFFYLIELST